MFLARNRRAHHDYTILEKLEAGLVLTGSEVKSLRSGQASLNEAFATVLDAGELYLVGASIPTYKQSGAFNHEPRRNRKLLLKKRERNKLIGRVKLRGETLIPLDIHVTKRGWIKVTLALCTGKKAPDKRASEKERDWKRQKSRLLKGENA